MKYLKSRFILLAMLAASPMMNAQTAENDTDTAGSEDKVHVAYRDVAEEDLLGSVAVLDYEKLTEKNYNTYSLDNLQGYVSGWNGNSLWGMDADNAGYLVLIDGVPRDANNVMPTEIAQVTFLKSAQAVVLMVAVLLRELSLSLQSVPLTTVSASAFVLTLVLLLQRLMLSIWVQLSI